MAERTEKGSVEHASLFAQEGLSSSPNPNFESVLLLKTESIIVKKA